MLSRSQHLWLLATCARFGALVGHRSRLLPRLQLHLPNQLLSRTWTATTLVLVTSTRNKRLFQIRQRRLCPRLIRKRTRPWMLSSPVSPTLRTTAQATTVMKRQRKRELQHNIQSQRQQLVALKSATSCPSTVPPHQLLLTQLLSSLRWTFLVVHRNLHLSQQLRRHQPLVSTCLVMCLVRPQHHLRLNHSLRCSRLAPSSHLWASRLLSLGRFGELYKIRKCCS